MIKAEDVNRIIGISESFKMPETLMNILLSGKKDIFEKFSVIESDMSYDWFNGYFQEEHSNRKAMMQDFTPKELTELLPRLTNEYSTVLDVCAGTGGLTIGAWSKNPNALFVCEELSERALPLLIFNLAIRNINGWVINKNILTGEIFAIYRLIKDEKYSDIFIEVLEPTINKFDLIITNPPYSLKHEWKEVPDYITDYGEPPTKAADYGFLLYGLSKMTTTGTMCAILPHGVLFRGQKEGAIRESLIKRHLINSIIGLPEKLFLNTGIPVCVMVVKSNSENLFFIEASREYLKNTKQNSLRKSDADKIINTFWERTKIDKYADVVTYEVIENNGFNLNISRYVDTFEEETLPDLKELTDELIQIKGNIRIAELELVKQLKELVALDAEDQIAINQYIRYLEE
ncbi:MAG: N-6 DNA methylase [Firmicutes bacterium]|nr:N-6 DNA methylase [Bacillota bacterium]